jgi:hypothetical protein
MMKHFTFMPYKRQTFNNDGGTVVLISIYYSLTVYFQMY